MHTFLIVEDSPRKMTLLRDFVERALWPGDTLQATTTEDAKHLIDTHHSIAAAFVDYYIPSEWGPAVIAYLRERRPHAKIALVSSSDSAANREEALAAGAQSFVCTSWQSDVVEHTLTSLLAEWKAGL